MQNKIKKLIICNHIYDITYECEPGNYGVAYFNSQRINLTPELGDGEEENIVTENLMARTLFHEVLHVIFKTRFEYVKPISKLSQKEEEHIIDEIANNMYEFLISNQHVLELLKEHSLELQEAQRELVCEKNRHGEPDL